MKRLHLEGPDWNGHFEEYEWIRHKGLRESLKIAFDLPVCGYGGDEYGNPSVYFRCGLAGIVFFYGRHVQDEIELPEPGENAYIDKTYYFEDT